jgi:hypothetical protein
VTLAIAPDRFHFFDLETGQAITAGSTSAAVA